MKNILLALLVIAPISFSSASQIGNDIDGKNVDDLFGVSVALSSDGSVVAIGAPYNNGNGIDSGYVRIYQWDGLSWNQRGADLNGEAADDWAHLVSLSSDGSIVSIGAPNNDGNGADSGHVRIYKWDGLSWNQLGSDINGKVAGDRSCIATLSSDGQVVAIGAPMNDGNGTDSGHVRLYQWDGVSWNQLGNDIEGEAVGDESGSAVALSSDGSVVAIGASENDGNGTDSGHVRLYEWDGISWNQLGNDINGEYVSDYSGTSVALSSDGSVVAIGADYNSVNGSFSAPFGHVRLYEWDGISWNQIGNDIDGEAEGDQFGKSVSLSADGSIVAIGAPDHMVNGSPSGYVRLYEWDGISWNQFGSDIDGEAAYDNFGHSLSLSADGSIIVVGGYGNGNYAGHARIFRTFLDSDDDGLSDEYETNISFTNPNNADSDNDGFTDGEEIDLSLDPNVSNADIYSFLDSKVKDLRVGSQTFGVSNGNAKIRMYVDESSDLTSTWSNTQHVLELDIPADADTKFYRFRMD